MSMNDPIADMLTRIRNAQLAGKVEVSMPSAKQKVAIAEVLKSEGYVEGFSVKSADGMPVLTVALKYHNGKPVIEHILDKFAGFGIHTFYISVKYKQKMILLLLKI